MVNDFVSLGYPRHQVTHAVRRLLIATLVVSPTLPLKEAGVVVPDSLPQSLRIALSPKGYYYLRTIAANAYYRARVAQDTIWYDKDLAERYIRLLQESMDYQPEMGVDDALVYTDAGDVFRSYLRENLLVESEMMSGSYHSVEWARQVEDMAQKAVFGAVILGSKPSVLGIDSKESDLEPGVHQPKQGAVRFSVATAHRHTTAPEQTTTGPAQLSFLESEGGATGDDTAQELARSANALVGL